MRICVASNLHDRSDSRVYFREVLSLARRYGAVTLMTPCSSRPSAPLDRRVRYTPLRTGRSWLGRALAVAEVTRRAAKLHPDVFHFHDFDLILTVPLLRVLTRTRIVYDVHEAYAEAILTTTHSIPNALRGPLSRLVNAIEKSLAGLCDLVVAADSATAATFACSRTQVVTVPNYPLLGLFEDTRVDQSFETKTAGRKVVIYHGDMSPSRGLFHMIRAASILNKTDRSIVLVLVGELPGGLLRQVQCLARELAADDSILLIPFVSHASIASYIRTAKIGLLPLQPTKKHMKNVPTKMFEYMACGVPVLGADIPPIAQYLLKADAGRVFDSTRPESLASGVLEMLENPAELRRMGENGRRAVVDRWNWAEAERCLVDAYDRLTAT